MQNNLLDRFIAANGDAYELHAVPEQYGARVLRFRSDTKLKDDIYGIISPSLARRYFDQFKETEHSVRVPYGRTGKPRGFGSMSKEKHAAIARLGGLAVQKKGKAHKWTSEEARAAGRIGGRRKGVK